VAFASILFALNARLVQKGPWLLALALGLGLAACTGENQQAPRPIDLTEAGAFVAVLDEDGLTFFLERVLGVDRFPEGIETVLHLSIYEERASSVAEATELAKRPFLYVEFPHIAVLTSDFIRREHAVVWFRTLTPEEASNLQK
jgi:hypothetical protein